MSIPLHVLLCLILFGRDMWFFILYDVHLYLHHVEAQWNARWDEEAGTVEEAWRRVETLSRWHYQNLPYLTVHGINPT